MKTATLTLPLVLFFACSDTTVATGPVPDPMTDPTVDPTTDPMTDPMVDPMMMPDPRPAPRCTPGTRWSPGTAAFRDATSEWGLDALAVKGVRLSVTDIDGDGYADLFARAVGNGSDDFAAGTRTSWLLKNTGTGGFTDVTEQSGIRTARGASTSLGRPGEVVAFADVDNDGDLDVYTGMNTTAADAMPGQTSEILLNDGSGLFSLAPEDNQIRRPLGVDVVAGASFADIDRDGNIDLWVGEHNYTPSGSNGVVFQGDHLYRGTGGGLFEEITASAGLSTVDWIDIRSINEGLAHSRAWSATACDLNGDGTVELMTASYGRAPNHLWLGRANGDGTVQFENRSVASGYAYDENRDWRDNEFAKCYCQANPSAEGCAEVAAPRIGCSQQGWRHDLDREAFRLGGNSGATVCADINNDGWMDLLTTEITHWWAGSNADRSEILLNTQDPEVTFSRPGIVSMGLDRNNPDVNWDNGDMSAAVFDFDNDGLPDVYIGASDYPGNRGLLFHQEGATQFVRVGIEDGIDHTRSHGIAVADFDRDGDLDVIVGHSRARCESASDCYPDAHARFFENVLGDQGNWIQVALEGSAGTNKSAIGARVTVTAGGVTQTQDVDGGHGHYGAQRDPALHFGLGTACEAEVTVRWPDATLTTETFDLAAGYRFKIVQGGEAEVVE